MSQTVVQKLQQIIDESNNIVFFGGAGVSTESGIPDFRSVDGLYNQQYDYPPEVMLSRTFYYRHKEDFFKFYRNKILAYNALPNAAHQKLAQLEAAGKLSAVITQNIDGLHQAAGSQNVIELHGSIHRNYCEDCGAFYDMQYMRDADGLPRCNKCTAHVKPDVVLYEEGLNSDDMRRAVKHISEADALIIGGTSLVVYPAAGLVDYYDGGRLVLINKGSTHKDQWADLVIGSAIGETLAQITI